MLACFLLKLGGREREISSKQNIPTSTPPSSIMAQSASKAMPSATSLRSYESEIISSSVMMSLKIIILAVGLSDDWDRKGRQGLRFEWCAGEEGKGEKKTQTQKRQCFLAAQDDRVGFLDRGEELY